MTNTAGFASPNTEREPYLGRDSPWRAENRQRVDVWTVARAPTNTQPATAAATTHVTRFVIPRHFRPSRERRSAPHSLPLAA